MIYHIWLSADVKCYSVYNIISSGVLIVGEVLICKLLLQNIDYIIISIYLVTMNNILTLKDTI